MWPWTRLWHPVPATQAIPSDLWRDALTQLPYCQVLDRPTQARLRQLSVEFLRHKTFETAAGLTLTDSMRVRIALQASVLILNLDFDYYAGWHAVILYPGDFRVSKVEVDETGVVHQWREELSGEAWEQGPVILSWDAAQTFTPNRPNIVLHEFAHKLDMRNGRADGFPPLPAGMSATSWAQDFQAAYTNFCEQLEQGQPVRIDEYAAENPAEFFAVLSEAFFVQPQILHTDFAPLYQQLREFYRQDPLTLLRPQ